jgi:serine/threonine-protein kinase CHEK2
LISKGCGTYTNKIDNWSLGVILYICLVGYPPFTDEDPKVSLEKQIKLGLYEFPDEYWSSVSAEAKEIIKRLMCINPNKRASLDEILEHEWIKNDLEMQKKAHELMYPSGSTNGEETIMSKKRNRNELEIDSVKNSSAEVSSNKKTKKQ